MFRIVCETGQEKVTTILVVVRKFHYFGPYMMMNRLWVISNDWGAWKVEVTASCRSKMTACGVWRWRQAHYCKTICDTSHSFGHSL